MLEMQKTTKSTTKVNEDVKVVITMYSGVSNLANSNLAISLFSDSLDTGKNLDLAILSRI